jgi:capsular exopolysaccharide synthesis family protein
VADKPSSVLAENFHLLWSNIEFFRISNPIKTILITSPSQGNGKTTIASNLAVSIAQEGYDVVLVDADLRRPAVHRSLNISRAPGLGDVICNQANLQSVVRRWDGENNLNVITSGLQPSNITEVASSNRIAAILSELKKDRELIIVDAPPLIIADSFNLASKADGIVIVIEPGQTTEEQARAMKEQLARANATIVGFVFNKVSEASAHSYGDYQYRSMYLPRYYEDYVGNSNRAPVNASRSKQLTDFFEHGKIPDDVTTGVKSAITAIKTQPRNMLGKMKKTKKNNHRS